MKRRLEVGQVWVVESDYAPKMFWRFEIVAKLATPDGIRCIGIKLDAPVTSVGVAIFNEDGTTPEDQSDMFCWFVTKKSKRPPIYGEGTPPP